MDDQLLHHLAKVELHCHLDGSLSLPLIRQLAARIDLPVPEADADLRRLVQAPAEATDLMDYLRPFDFIRPLLQDHEALAMAAYDVAAQAAEENVRYIEIRFAPEFSMDAGLTATQAITAVVDGLSRAQAELAITAKVLVCGMRQSAEAVNRPVFAATAPLLGHGVVGGDFAGNEADFPPSVIQPSIAYAQSLGVPLTFHAGECHCAQNIAQALAMGITRIGHATAIHAQPQLIVDFVKAGATAELCLTSNRQTRAITQLADYPYPELRRAGAKLTINTDNRTVSNVTLTHEYQAFVAHFGVTVADLLTFNQNAARAAFIPASDQEALVQRLAAEYQPYL